MQIRKNSLKFVSIQDRMQRYTFFEKYTREANKLTERIPMTRVPGDVRRFIDTKIAELARFKKGKVDLGEVIRYLLITHPEFQEFLDEIQDEE